MAKLSFCIIPSRANSDGSHYIRLKITSKNTTAYIITRYKIEKTAHWKDGKIVKHPDAEFNNRKLRTTLAEYENILDGMPNPSVTATEVKAYLETHFRKSDSLKDHAEVYIARLEKEGRKSYAQNMGYTLKYLLECFGESMTLQQFTPTALGLFEKHLRKGGSSDTTINIRMSHLKALLNAAVNDGTVEYKVFPFRNYKIPAKAVRDICISKEELQKLREAEFKGISERRHTVARDLFLLSFYCAFSTCVTSQSNSPAASISLRPL